MESKTLLTFRVLCGKVAWVRDNGKCMYCLYVRGRGAQPGAETDHVFGRGMGDNWAAEHWAVRLTLCQECHHEKHHGGHGWFTREEEIYALAKANLDPQMPNWNPHEVEALVVMGKSELELFDLFDMWREPAWKLWRHWADSSGGMKVEEVCVSD